MRVIWLPAAKEDREEIFDRIAADNPRAANRMDELFEAAAQRLARFPHAGRPGKLPGSRELIPHESYRMVYQLDGETVWVLAVLHTARRWPPVAE